MNIPRDIERTIRDILANSDNLPLGARVVAWQTPAETEGWDKPDSPAWSPELDRMFPSIDVRCTPPGTENDDQTALVCDVAILAATKAADDRNRAVISAMYAFIQEWVDSVAFGRYAGRGTAFEDLGEALARYEPRLILGGVTLGTPTPPAESASLYLLGVEIRIHFSLFP